MSRVCAVARRRRVGACVLSGLAAALAASAACLETGPALAFGEYTALEAEPPPLAARKIRRRAPKPAARETKRVETPSPDRPLFAVISIGNQSISIYNHHGLVERSMVSTGMPGHPTPEGVFTILGRERMHHSNIYSGAPMPFMQRVTWSGVAMHLGVVPGHPASHGCIRLPAGFAAKLWGLTRIGERVVIAPHEVAPTEISHPALPSPKMQIEAQAETPAGADGVQTAVDAAEPPLLDPRKYAEKLVARAAAEAAAAAKAAKEADAAIPAARQESARAAVELRAVEAAHAGAKARAEAAAKSFEAARVVAERAAAERHAVASATPESAAASDGKAEAAKESAAVAKTAAEAALAEATAKLDAARAGSAAKAAEFGAAVQRAKEATLALASATKAEKDARLRTAPISVLVSKKDRKVYVRQGLTPLFDAPASIRDPELPLGSHLFIATATESGGKDLKWSVVSLPARYAEARGERRKKNGLVEERSATTRGPASSPAEALDRVEIAQDVRDRIAERLWLGGSLIVSDQPPSVETGAVGTDLTVKLR